MLVTNITLLLFAKYSVIYVTLPIPALVLLSKLPMKEAVGTSLVIIAAKSLIGFFGEGGEEAMGYLIESYFIDINNK